MTADPYGTDALVRDVHRLLAARAATVAVAESLTGGLLGAALTGPAGSSTIFAGGVVAYATELKQRLLEVPADLLAAHGAVHPEVARAMAAGACRLLRTPYGLAVTGVAGPDPQDGQPVGTVFAAVAEASGGSVVEPLRLAPSGGARSDAPGGAGLGGTGDAPGGAAGPVPGQAPGAGARPAARAAIRARTVVHALDLLRRHLEGPAGPGPPAGGRGGGEQWG